MEAKEILESHGATIDLLTDAAFALYVGRTKRTDMDKLKQKFKKRLEENLNDPNVALLIAAAAHLDGIVKSMSKGAFSGSKDPSSIVADELIGMSIAEYIAGKKGLFNYVRYDKEKPGILAKLPPFMDDAAGALLAGTMTRLFEE